MIISVIVPNHGRDLKKLIYSLPNSVELVVVDEGLERSTQRNMGINKAKGFAFLILDSDQSVSPGLIDECEDILRQGYDCAYIPEVIVADSFFGKIRAFERTFYTGTSVDVPRLVTRKACPYFDENLTGPEDADWGNRIKGDRAITKNVLFHHDDIGFIEYCKKKAYYTKSMLKYQKKWPDDKCLKLKYRCWTVFAEKGKWKKLLRHPVLSIGIIFILTVRGVIYYANR